MAKPKSYLVDIITGDPDYEVRTGATLHFKSDKFMAWFESNFPDHSAVRPSSVDWLKDGKAVDPPDANNPLQYQTALRDDGREISIRLVVKGRRGPDFEVTDDLAVIESKRVRVCHAPPQPVEAPQNVLYQLSDNPITLPIAAWFKGTFPAFEVKSSHFGEIQPEHGVVTLPGSPAYSDEIEVIARNSGGSASIRLTVIVGQDDTTALLPELGKSPTETLYFSKVYLKTGSLEATEKIDLETDALDPLAAGTTAYTKPAFGMRVTVRQDWVAHTLTLGQLIHSVALAPGESTRIAIVDWTRRTAAARREHTDQLEDLAMVGDQTRVLSEFSRAMAQELQHGRSTTGSESQSDEFGATGALGSYLGLSGGYGSTKSVATSVSTTSGTRSVAQDLTQFVHDRTNQHVTSARGRNAAVVVETSQSESDIASTRILTNYNHMHALTIQYFEVLQVYRSTTKANKFEPLLFVPFKAVSFNTESASRYRSELALAARDLPLHPMPPQPYTSWEAAIGAFQDTRLEPQSTHPARGMNTSRPVTMPKGGQIVDIETRIGDGPVAGLNPLYNEECLLTLIVRKQDLPGKKSVEEINFTATAHGHTDRVDINLAGLSSLTVKYGQEGFEKKRFSLRLRLSDGAAHPHYSSMELLVELPQADSEAIIATATEVVDPEVIISHLNKFKEHYTKALFAAPNFSIQAALEHYSYKGKGLLDIIDPEPVAVKSNLIAFLLTDSSIAESFNVTDLTVKSEGISRDIALPTGGVFAEAVLGKSNGAEKLDITRFWNWQDSPIPILPPEIAPVSLGSRAQAIDPTTHSLESPLAQLQSLSQLPDTKLAGTVGRALVEQIFRDMSNANEAAETARALAEQSRTGAGDATERSAEAYAQALQHQREMLKLAASAAKDLIPLVAPELGAAEGGGALLGAALRSGGAGKGGASISHLGALMNSASDIDRDMGSRGITKSVMQAITGAPILEEGWQWQSTSGEAFHARIEDGQRE